MALEYYTGNAVSADDVFKLSVPTAAISAHLSKYEYSCLCSAVSLSFCLAPLQDL